MLLGWRLSIIPHYSGANPEDPRVWLKPVFENGVILRQHTFEQVRARARYVRILTDGVSAVRFSEASAV
jgi:hypothetical protein